MCNAFLYINTRMSRSLTYWKYNFLEICWDFFKKKLYLTFNSPNSQSSRKVIENKIYKRLFIIRCIPFSIACYSIIFGDRKLDFPKVGYIIERNYQVKTDFWCAQLFSCYTQKNRPVATNRMYLNVIILISYLEIHGYLVSSHL